MNDWIKIVLGAIFVIALLVFSFWSNNGGQLSVDKCTFAKDPASCRAIKSLRETN